MRALPKEELDSGTGIPNIRYLERVLKKADRELTLQMLTPTVDRARARELAEQRLREEQPKRKYPGHITVVASDLDHFKSINDLYGHDHGDLILRAFAKFLEEASQTRREQDAAGITGRSGGEEFTQIYYATGSNDAARITEETRKRLNIRRAPPDEYGNPNGDVLSFSAGVASLNFLDLADDLSLMCEGKTPQELIESKKYKKYIAKKIKKTASLIAKAFGRKITVVHTEEINRLMELNKRLAEKFRNLRGQFYTYQQDHPVSMSQPLPQYAAAKASQVMRFMDRTLGDHLLPQNAQTLFYDAIHSMPVCPDPRNNQGYGDKLIDRYLRESNIRERLRSALRQDDIQEAQSQALQHALNGLKPLEELL